MHTTEFASGLKSGLVSVNIAPVTTSSCLLHIPCLCDIPMIYHANCLIYLLSNIIMPCTNCCSIWNLQHPISSFRRNIFDSVYTSWEGMGFVNYLNFQMFTFKHWTTLLNRWLGVCISWFVSPRELINKILMCYMLTKLKKIIDSIYFCSLKVSQFQFSWKILTL